MMFLISSVTLVVVLFLYLRQSYSRLSSYGVKHFKIVPLFGNMLKMILGQQHIAMGVDEMYKQFRDERFIGRYEFIKPTVIVKDLDLIKKVAIKDFEHFLDRRDFLDEKKEPLFARSLFSLRGQEWKDMRSTLSPAFTSSKIKLMVPFIEEVGEQMIQALKKQIKESKSGSIDVDVRDLTSRYTNDVIASCAFGLKVDSHTDRDNQFFEMGKTAATFTFRQSLLFFLGAAFPTLVNILNLQLFSESTKKFFSELVTNTMKDRELRNINRSDMIQILMEIKKGKLTHDNKNGIDSHQDTGFATVEDSFIDKKAIDREWSDIDLIAQGVVFFIAGFDTISTATSFALHELALNPNVQERLVQEIKEHHHKNGGKLDFNSVQNLTYMDMVISESLRMWPPVPALDRICRKEYNLGRPNPKAPKDYIIRKGDTVLIPVWSIHRDSEFYQNPDKFDPERFSADNKHKINPGAYMPFGVGPRNCIGSRFALCECKMLIYHILLNIEVTPTEKTCIPSRLEDSEINPRLHGGHWLKFKARC